MHKYILFFLFSCTQTIEPAQLINSVQSLDKAEYVVLNRPEFPDDYHQIEYVGNWKHMTIEEQGKTGSFASTKSDTARYAFWGYGIQIRTELMSGHEAYKIFIDDKFIQSVNVKNEINTTHNLTYSNMNLLTGNHVLELVPDGGYFVLNTLTIHYYTDPTPEDPCINDTIYITQIDTLYLHDTIYITKLVIDSVILQPKIYIEADEIIYELN